MEENLILKGILRQPKQNNPSPTHILHGHGFLYLKFLCLQKASSEAVVVQSWNVPSSACV